MYRGEERRYDEIFFTVYVRSSSDEFFRLNLFIYYTGLSWGTSAVEMGLNRMSALGVGKPLTKSVAESSATSFVTFKNGTLPVKEGGDSGSDKKVSKKFGF